MESDFCISRNTKPKEIIEVFCITFHNTKYKYQIEVNIEIDVNSLAISLRLLHKLKFEKLTSYKK